MKITKNQKLFAAFFIGGGMLRISFNKRKGGNRFGKNYGKTIIPWYRQVIRITLRQDDEKILDWIKNEIGGHIFRRGIRYKIWNKQRGIFTWSRPVTIWQAEDLDTCELIAKLIIQCPIPSKKKEEAKYFLEYVKLKKDNFFRGKSYPKEVFDKFEFYYQKLKELKRYNEKVT